MEHSRDDACAPDSYFAPPQRLGPEAIARQLEAVSHHPLIDGILRAVSGLLAVLNEHRQILAVNDSLLTALGVKDCEPLLGLRPGEAVQCAYAPEGPSGCGTAKPCANCGAVISMVTALATNQPAEEQCAIVVQKDGREVDLLFQVRCSPIEIDGQRFLLLFLRDISEEQQRASLERVFYHDVSNVIENLLFNSRMLQSESAGDEGHGPADQILGLASRLAKEVRIQKALARGPAHYSPTVREAPISRITANLVQTFHAHPIAREKNLQTAALVPDVQIKVDAYLLDRVLTNMVTNAMEATPAGGEVRFWIETDDTTVTFCVWNALAMSEGVARRIFQRNFSTKPGSGRGLGTYAMRLLGETFLRGKVDFTTSEADGTLFRFQVPKTPPREARD
jgi:hypothetical protein